LPSTKSEREWTSQQIVETYGLTDGKTKGVPLSPYPKLSKEDGSTLDKDVYPFSKLIGSLMYLAVTTRPDIAYAVGALARYMSCPTMTHWQAAKGVLRYIAGTANVGITFGSSDLTLEAYCDADYAGDTDTRRSTTGYVFILGGGAISWSSRLQPTVAASTTEAEYMAAGSACKEALWLRKLAKDLGLNTGAIAIGSDNQGAIKLLRNPVTSMRSKHIDVVHHFARERVSRGEVNYHYVNTNDMIADALTKPLPPTKFIACRNGMGMQ